MSAAFPNGPKGLARVVKQRGDACHKAGNVIFALALHGNERFNEIVARLGDDHPKVKAYRVAADRKYEVIAECRRRYGNAVTFDSLWETFLLTVRC